MTKQKKVTTNRKKDRPLVSFDWAIKRLLRNKANYDVLEGFLSELLMCPVKIISILESESNKDHAKDKSNRADMIVEDDKGEIILIEIQFLPEMDYFQRMLFGVSKNVVDHMVEGDKYMTIKKVYSINIVYFDLGQGKDYVYHGKTIFEGLHEHDVLLLSEEQKKILNGIEAGDIFPEYYVLKINKFDDVAKDTLDEWVYFLKNDRIEDGFKAKGLLKAREVLDYNRLSPEEQAEYDRAQKEKSKQRSQIATAKDTGRAEGRTEAEQEYVPIIEEQRKALEEKNKALEEKEREIAELKRLLNKK
jgi:predicted transposase/invertase (TIGR01784 family)